MGKLTNYRMPNFHEHRGIFLLYITYGFITTLISFLFFFRHNILTTAHIFGIGQDPRQYVWFIAWWPYAVRHFINPFWTTMQWYPHGFDLALTTSIPFISFAVYPITYFFGPLVAFNIITILSPALAATAAMALFHKITRNILSSFVGGYIFGFSPYELGQLQGHLHLDFIGIIPVLLIMIYLYWHNRTSKKFFILSFSTLLVFQFCTSLEIFSTFTYCGFLSILYWFAIDNDNRSRIMSLFYSLLISYVISLAICTPYIYYFFSGLITAPAGFPYATHSMQANLLNYIIPNPTIWYFSIFNTPINISSTSDANDTYVGIVIFIIILYYSLRFNLNKIDKVALFTLSTTIILSLGSRIYIGNNQICFGPWELVKHLPTLRYALPNRLSLYVWICIAFILTHLIARLCSDSRRLAAGTIAILSVFSIIPNITLSNHVFNTTIKNNTFIMKTINSLQLNGANVLFIPFKSSTYPMFYQALSGMRFNIEGGYLGQPQSVGLWPVARTLINLYPLADPKIQFSAFLYHYNVTRIFLLRTSAHYKQWYNLLCRFDYNKKSTPLGTVFFVTHSSQSHILRGDSASYYNDKNEYDMAKNLISGFPCIMSRHEQISSVYDSMTSGCTKNIFTIDDSAYHEYDLIGVNNWTIQATSKNIKLITNGWYPELKLVIRKYCRNGISCFYPYPKRYNNALVNKNTRGVLLIEKKNQAL